MSANQVELTELKEWLTNEVKLERYFEKLTKYGFNSLSLIQNLEESDLDSVGITPPYHRKRMLKFCKDLQIKQAPHVNKECARTGNDPNELGLSTRLEERNEDYEHNFDDSNEEAKIEPPPLPPKLGSGDVYTKPKPVVPDVESSLPRQLADYNTESNTPTTSATADSSKTKQIEAKEPNLLSKTLPGLETNSSSFSECKEVKKPKKPPPIPRRSDLESETVVSCEAQGGKIDETNGDNEQIDLAQDIEKTGDSTAEMPYYFTEKASAPKPVPRPRVGKEKPLSAPRSLANQPTHCSEVTKYAKNELVEGRELPCSEGECAQKSKVDSEPIYCNKEECLQAIVAPLREVEKPANKKPLPLPRQKPQQLSLAQQAESDKLRFPLLHGQERNQEFRHSIAVSGQFTNKTADEEEKATQLRNGALHTRSLHRLDKLVPVVSQHEILKKAASLTKESTAIYTSVQPNHHKPVSPSADFDEQDVFGGVPKDNKVSSEYLGTYEDVKMPNDRNRPESREEIYEPLNDYGKSNNPNDYSMAGEIEPSKKKKSTAEDVIYDYESDESTEGLLLEEPPELPEERKTRGDSTDSFDAKLPKSVTPKSRKTSGYLFKQGGQQNNRGWKKRWFVFDGKELRYYRCKENTQESLHVIPVSQMKNIEFEKEAKKGRFNLITANRVFMLSSDSMTDTNLWAQTLMEAILQYKGDDSTKKNGGMMSDPDKEGWLKKQGHNVMGDWKRRYVAIKEDIICYYDTYEDFTYETPIHCVEAKLASVKQDLGHRNRFLIVTPYKAFSFQAENEFEAASWISAIQTAIQMGLSDHAVINQVWSNPANKKCADCGKKDPVWASVNYCICVCARCIGIHRSMGVKYSKPRSLLMDEKIWNMQLLELMLKVGNDNANKLLEFRIPDDDRINPDSDNEKRIEFIFSKYKDMKYMKISEDYGKREALGQSLQKAVVKDDILKTMELLINRADVKYTNSDSEDQRTPLELAKDAGQELQAELLRQNGADAIEEPSPLIPDEDAVGFVKVDAAELPPQPLAEVPDKAGYLLLLKKKYWFTLKDRHLKYFRNQMDKDPIGVLDLAAVTLLELHASEDTRTLDIVTPEKAYTLKGESDEELESWYAAIKNKQVFNVHLGFQELGSDGIPHLVAHCLQFVETYGLQAEGVYRVSGNQAKIRALTQSFNQDASRVMLTLDDYSVHDVTGTLKKYLRELPEPVVPDNMYKTFIMASCHPDHDTKLYAIKDALVKLPKVNYDTLKRIIGHLKKVIADQAINRMGIENISMIFAPTLMSNENTGKMDNTSINQEFKIIGDLIHYYEWFFDVDDKELIKDKLMAQARKKILQIQEPGQSGMNQEFNLDIYVQQKNDSPCLIKVAAGMTAGELSMNIIQKKALQTEINWALFEVIGKLNLERTVHHREKVLPVVMSWEAFGEISKGNYLIIKENHIAESIQPFIGTSLTLEGQLHVREPKRKDWKLSTVILKNGYMVVDKSKSFFKTIKSDKSDNDQWSLHNLVVFLGVPSEKSTKGVDTSAGFTVVVKTDLNGNLMRYLCAKDKTEMYRWVAAILNMKHPEGIWTDPIAAAELKTRRVKDEQIYLGRQSRYLRTEGSSKHIVQEIGTRRTSLRRSGPVS